jgi:hypothetical protein
LTSKCKIIPLDGGRMAFLDGLKRSLSRPVTSSQPEGNVQTMLASGVVIVLEEHVAARPKSKRK